MALTPRQKAILERAFADDVAAQGATEDVLRRFGQRMFELHFDPPAQVKSERIRVVQRLRNQRQQTLDALDAEVQEAKTRLAAELAELDALLVELQGR